MSEDELIPRLVADLEQSGVGSEMRVARAMLDRGWAVNAGASFFDRDEGITREFDLRANLTRKAALGEDALVWFYLFLAVEVKKSKKPWVILRHSVDYTTAGGGWGQLIEASRLPVRAFDLTRALSRLSLTSDQQWRGYGVHESFKSPSKPSRWWAAAVSASKAAEGVVEGNKMEVGAREREDDQDDSRPCFFTFVRPVVVLDGELFAADTQSGGDIEVEPVPFGTFQFRFRTKQYGRSAYYLDLVKYSALDQYLEFLDSRSDEFVRELVGRGGHADTNWELDRTAREY